LSEIADYLDPAPRRSDVRSVWVGLRPLVNEVKQAASGPTSALSREHTVVVDPSGLVTVTGGKWTTYRAMAQDVLAQCVAHGLLPKRGPTSTDTPGGTASQALLGAPRPGMAPRKSLSEPPGEHLYGSEAAELRTLPGAEHWLAYDAETRVGILSEAMVRFAVRHEMAQDVEDVLARRSRLLFLDARQAAAVAPAVAAILQEELGAAFDPAASLASFQALAAQYATLP
jgi:glycerol-3-phosphate dehydrogenase